MLFVSFVVFYARSAVFDVAQFAKPPVSLTHEASSWGSWLLRVAAVLAASLAHPRGKLVGVVFQLQTTPNKEPTCHVHLRTL